MFFFSYTEVVNITGTGRNHMFQQIIGAEDDTATPKPDVSQMIPYKPKAIPLPGEHPIPGTKITFNSTYIPILH